MIFKEIEYQQVFKHRKLGLMRKESFHERRQKIYLVDNQETIFLNEGAVKLDEPGSFYYISEDVEVESI